MTNLELTDRVVGCVLGGAVGDALGVIIGGLMGALGRGEHAGASASRPVRVDRSRVLSLRYAQALLKLR